MWSMDLPEEKNSSIEPSHLVVIHHIFLLNPQVKIHKWEKNQLCSKTGLRMHIHPKTTLSVHTWASSARHSTPVYDGSRGSKKMVVPFLPFTILPSEGAALQLDGNKVSRTRRFYFTRRCLWLLLQKASLGGCYCKRLAVVVACAGHTCINRTSFRLPNMSDITIAVAIERWRKALAREAKHPHRCSGSGTAWLSLSDSPLRGNVSVCIAFFTIMLIISPPASIISYGYVLWLGQVHLQWSEKDGGETF